MTQHTHTPGPWTTTGTYVYGPDDEDIAKVSNVKDSGVIAAAPDLLAALITCQKALSNHWFSDNDGESYNNEDVIDADNLAKAAIRKAYGEA